MRPLPLGGGGYEPRNTDKSWWPMALIARGQRPLCSEIEIKRFNGKPVGIVLRVAGFGERLGNGKPVGIVLRVAGFGERLGNGKGVSQIRIVDIRGGSVSQGVQGVKGVRDIGGDGAALGGLLASRF